ncbi:hypothetical protein BKA65DRAFT_558657 [Rhexocercosporidium sp. MPI-PUGE-AT-0058]|nr:hypothetical protein BKA65DRAFT_558657 [Rhexocercosporidium sp. MPI-PUGE-AT-0058]
MESVTAIIAPIFPALSISTNTMAANMSESSTPKDSPKLEPTNIPTVKEGTDLKITKFETESDTKTEAKTNTEKIAPPPAINSLLARPTLLHANTDTLFEVAREEQRVKRRWRGMYDRNRAANPGATHGS